MIKTIKYIGLGLTVIIVAGCSVFGKSGVEIAPYRVLEKENEFELRHYENLVLVSTSMSELNAARSPFSKLFKYISGKNADSQKIKMTAPVFMDQVDAQSETMSFVLPTSINMDDAPLPADPSVKLKELTDYTVATITFNGRLQQNNIDQHKKELEAWILEKGFKPIGSVKAAGYNPPFTLPAYRRNEVLIQVEKP